MMIRAVTARARCGRGPTTLQKPGRSRPHRGDSAYGDNAVVTACVQAGARFSVMLTKNPAVARAIAAIANRVRCVGARLWRVCDGAAMRERAGWDTMFCMGVIGRASWRAGG